MENALFLTLLVGFFFAIGIYIPKFFQNRNKLILTATSMSFIIMLYLMIFDLTPEIISSFDIYHNIYNLLIMIMSILVGIALLKILDKFIPEHSHEHHEKEDNIEEHNNHLYHIGVITSISLTIHNILEGISIYITAIGNFKLGLLMSLTVGFHNLPLGTTVSLELEASKKNKITETIILLLLVTSSFFGALLLYILKINLSELLESILLSITLGMIFYISVLELLPEVISNKSQKEIKMGTVFGIILVIILLFIG